jgi:dipeptidyl aminopeptidase/acylaminoacyl peptidase
MIETFYLQSAYNRISAVLARPDDHDRAYPCVVLSHGLVSSKDSSKWVQLAERLMDAGVAACRFDYHGCGESTGDIRHTSLTKRLENLSAIIDYLVNHYAVDGARLGIIGSSFGASTALIKAARDPRIRCTSLWATPHLLEKKDEETVSEILFDDELYDDFSSYDILGEAARVSRSLVIHGTADEVVPYREGVDIYQALSDPKACELIDGADHILSDPVHRERAVSLALRWFAAYL